LKLNWLMYPITDNAGKVGGVFVPKKRPGARIGVAERCRSPHGG
jgi:hypothetical protein